MPTPLKEALSSGESPGKAPPPVQKNAGRQPDFPGAGEPETGFRPPDDGRHPVLKTGGDS
jgi:hypothetical protein